MGSHPSWFTTNMFRTSRGNAANEGDTLEISVPGAAFISAAVYRKGSPVVALDAVKHKNNGRNGKAYIILKRKNMSLKGLCVLKLRAQMKNGTGKGADDAFEVL